MADSPPTPIRTAVRVIDAASQQGICLRAHGSCGCFLRASLYREGVVYRQIRDVDLFLSDRAEADRTIRLMESAGYHWDRRYSLHSNERLFFYSVSGLELDVSVSRLQYCHAFDPGVLADGDHHTIGFGALVLEKLQMAPSMEPKDSLDVVALLESASQDPNDANYLPVEQIARLVSKDWGFYYTVVENLKRIEATLSGREMLSLNQRNRVRSHIEELIYQTRNYPKSNMFRLRAKIGARLPWYTHVDSRIR